MENGKSGNLVSIEGLLQEAKEEYETIKTQCDSLNNVFEEYGYHYSEADILNE